MAVQDEEARLLAAIAANPIDDGPRLVYADWLEGRADPRVAYLHADAALAATPTLEAWEALLQARADLGASLGAEEGADWVDRVARRYDVRITELPKGYRGAPLIRLTRAIAAGGPLPPDPFAIRDALPYQLIAGVDWAHALALHGVVAFAIRGAAELRRSGVHRHLPPLLRVVITSDPPLLDANYEAVPIWHRAEGRAVSGLLRQTATSNLTDRERAFVRAVLRREEPMVHDAMRGVTPDEGGLGLITGVRLFVELARRTQGMAFTPFRLDVSRHGVPAPSDLPELPP